MSWFSNVSSAFDSRQVKASASIDFDDGEASVQVNVTTYNLWRAVPLLTILFHVDTSSGAI